MRLTKNNIILPKDMQSNKVDDDIFEEYATSFFKGLTFFVRTPFIIYKRIKDRRKRWALCK